MQYHIICSTGLARDLRYLAVLVHSVTEHFSSPGDLTFHVAHYNLPAEELAPFHLSVRDLPCRIESYRLDEEIGDEEKKSGFGFWFWLWAVEALPDLERVLYLDCDMLAYQDLSPLWKVDLRERVAGVVADSASRVHEYSRVLAKHATDYGYEFAGDSPYFNSGLYLIDLPRWRELRLPELVKERFFENYEAFPRHDQDALNLVLQDRVLFLSPRWNLIEPVILYENWDFELFEEYDPLDYFEPAVRHFCGFMKPDGMMSPASATADFYLYLDRTEWRGWRSPESLKWYRPLIGNLLDFHYLVTRGLKQRALDSVWSRIFRLLGRAPYAPLMYLGLPFYRAYRTRSRTA